MAFRPLGRQLIRSCLLWRAVPQSQGLRYLSQGPGNAGSGSSRRLYILMGVGSCAVGTVWWLGRDGERGGGRVVMPVVRAGGSEKGEEKPVKVSARELRYKSFASYVYKGEPYMSARDFLESLIRDKPRCEL